MASARKIFPKLPTLQQPQLPPDGLTHTVISLQILRQGSGGLAIKLNFPLNLKLLKEDHASHSPRG